MDPVNLRRCDRDVAAGFAWGGTEDDTGYGSEEILETTMFRVYRSIGGDSTSFLAQRRFASRMTMYLILRAISTLTPGTNPGNALGFANALMAVDLLNWTTEGARRRLQQGDLLVVREAGAGPVPAGAPTPAAKAGERPPPTSISTTGAAASIRISRSIGTRPRSGTGTRPTAEPSTKTRSSARPISPTSGSRTAARRPPRTFASRISLQAVGRGQVAERPAADGDAGDRGRNACRQEGPRKRSSGLSSGRRSRTPGATIA